MPAGGLGANRRTLDDVDWCGQGTGRAPWAVEVAFPLPARAFSSDFDDSGHVSCSWVCNVGIKSWYLWVPQSLRADSGGSSSLYMYFELFGVGDS